MRFKDEVAKAIAESRAGIGDQVLLKLEGAQWKEEDGKGEIGGVSTPGKRVGWILEFRRRIVAKFERDGALVASIDVDSPHSGHENIDETNEEPVAINYNDIHPSTPAPVAKVSMQDNPEIRETWSSPAFFKSRRLSATLIDPMQYDPLTKNVEEDGGILGKGRKRPRVSWGERSSLWKYVERTPSPEKDIPTNDDTLATQASRQPSSLLHSGIELPAIVNSFSDTHQVLQSDDGVLMGANRNATLQEESSLIEQIPFQEILQDAHQTTSSALGVPQDVSSHDLGEHIIPKEYPDLLASDQISNRKGHESGVWDEDVEMSTTELATEDEPMATDPNSLDVEESSAKRIETEDVQLITSDEEDSGEEDDDDDLDDEEEGEEEEEDDDLDEDESADDDISDDSSEATSQNIEMIPNQQVPHHPTQQQQQSAPIIILSDTEEEVNTATDSESADEDIQDVDRNIVGLRRLGDLENDTGDDNVDESEEAEDEDEDEDEEGDDDEEEEEEEEDGEESDDEDEEEDDDAEDESEEEEEEEARKTNQGGVGGDQWMGQEHEPKKEPDNVELGHTGYTLRSQVSAKSSLVREMPPPALPTLRIDPQFVAAPLTPELRPQTNSALPLPSPFPDDIDANVQSLADRFPSQTIHPGQDFDSTFSAMTDAPDAKTFNLEQSDPHVASSDVLQSLFGNNPSGQLEDQSERFPFGLDGSAWSGPAFQDPGFITVDTYNVQQLQTVTDHWSMQESAQMQQRVSDHRQPWTPIYHEHNIESHAIETPKLGRSEEEALWIRSSSSSEDKGLYEKPPLPTDLQSGSIMHQSGVVEYPDLPKHPESTQSIDAEVVRFSWGVPASATEFVEGSSGHVNQRETEDGTQETPNLDVPTIRSLMTKDEEDSTRNPTAAQPQLQLTPEPIAEISNYPIQIRTNQTSEAEVTTHDRLSNSEVEGLQALTSRSMSPGRTTENTGAQHSPPLVNQDDLAALKSLAPATPPSSRVAENNVNYPHLPSPESSQYTTGAITSSKITSFTASTHGILTHENNQQIDSSSQKLPKPSVEHGIQFLPTPQATQELEQEDQNNSVHIAPNSKTAISEHSPPSKRQIIRGFRTSLSYYTPLSLLHTHLNRPKSTVDVMGMVKIASQVPERSSHGPKDWFTTFSLVDSAEHGADTFVRIFRPWRSALPIVNEGDVVLLRNFVVKSSRSKVVLIDGEGAAWCCWRFDDNSQIQNGSEEIRGPPVEVGMEERKHAEQLRYYWNTRGRKETSVK